MPASFHRAESAPQPTLWSRLNKGMDTPRIGQLLLQRKLISTEQLNAALAAQRLSGERLGNILLQQNVVTKWQVRRAVILQKSLKAASIAATCAIAATNLLPTSARAAIPSHTAVHKYTPAQKVSAKPDAQIPTSQGTVWYVSAVSGNDNNTGLSAAKPFKSIGRALYSWRNTQFKGGDVVVVMPGTYNETVRFESTVAGHPGAYTTLMAMPGQPRPVIVGNVPSANGTWNGSCSGCGAINVWAPYVRVSGLDVSAPSPNYDGSAIDIGAGSTTDATGALRPVVHHVLIDNDVAHDSACAGILSDSADYVVLSNNVVYNNSNTAPNGCSGISVSYSIDYDLSPGYHNQVLDNIAYNNMNMVTLNLPTVFQCPKVKPDCHTDGNGIILDDNRRTQQPDKVPYQSKTLVFGNLSFNNGARGVEVFSSNNVDVINNTTYHNGKDTKLVNYPTDGSELSAAGATNVRMLNNIAVPLDATHPAVNQDSATSTVWSNNMTFGGILYIENSVKLSLGPTNLNGNPNFDLPSIDPQQANFRLNTGSLALRAGAPLSTPEVDLDGNTVATNTAVNIGTYTK